ncbi:MAG: type II secretion system GspH family protein [Proteobacteria bacterium]|nr:type II secretion system GspH family protein [Pseudomonadota bacterium]
MSHRRSVFALDEKAFTLLEILFVLLIVGFLAAASLKRFGELTDKHVKMGLIAGRAELNARESLIWANGKLSKTGWQDDATLFSFMDTDLGKDYAWTMDPSAKGGRLVFLGRYSRDLDREASTKAHPGRWRVHGQ